MSHLTVYQILQQFIQVKVSYLKEPGKFNFHIVDAYTATVGKVYLVTAKRESISNSAMCNALSTTTTL